MKKTNRQMRKNVMQRIPMTVKELVIVALERNPKIVRDLDKIVRTHSCRLERVPELTEHIVALVASELPKADRVGLRRAAFDAHLIDAGEKELDCTTITKLERGENGYNITRSDGWSMWLGFAADGYEPRVGSKIWCYTVGFSLVLGVVVDGHVFRYETMAQHRKRQEEELECKRAKERARFPEHDEAIARLPEIFQQRIRNFQRAPYFREDLEAYEIFVCEQATLFAERLKTVQELVKWKSLDYESQVKIIPELEEAGHSGNTFGAACVFARLYLEQPEALLKAPGALAPLVGSNAYLSA